MMRLLSLLLFSVFLVSSTGAQAQDTIKTRKHWQNLTEFDSLIIKTLNINSAFDESVPIMMNDGRLYFNSDRKNPYGQQAELAYNEGLYVSKKFDTGWAEPERKYYFNTDDQSALAGLCLDDTSIFIYKTFGDGDLYSSKNHGEKWTVPVPLHIPVNSGGHEQSAFEVGRLIYISSERDDNKGEHDLYSARIDDLGKYFDFAPIDILNSEFDEVDVSLSADGTTIFFSSNRIQDNYGGYDIYYSTKDPEGNWQPPKNLHSPINTEFNERYFYDCDSSFFICSNRPGSMGGYDIFEGALVPAQNPLKKNLLYVDISLLEKDTMMIIQRTRYGKMDRYLDSLGYIPHYARVQIGAYYGLSLDEFRSHYPSLKSTPIIIEKVKTPKGLISKFLVDQKFNTLAEAAVVQKEMIEKHRITDSFVPVYLTKDNTRVAIFNTFKDEFILLVGNSPPVKF